MSKSNKELAVDMMSSYIMALYSDSRNIAPIEPEDAKTVLKMFYDAVKELPDD